MRIVAIALVLSLTSVQLLAQNTPSGAIELITTLSGHTKSIEQIEFSASGNVVATSSSEEAFFDLPLQIASIYAVLGEKDEAFVWLERAVENRRAYRYDLRYNRQLKTLKDDLKFQQILRRHEFTKSLATELSKQNL